MTRWVTTSFPRRATLDASRPEPAAYLAGLLGQALRHGAPARRRGGPALAWVGRHGLPTRPLALVLRGLRPAPQPELDAVLEQVRARWPDLAENARRLPAEAPPLTALAVQRSAAWTVFVFGSGAHPLLVVKQPGASAAGVQAEAAALRAAEAAAVAPRLLGSLDGAVVQEGLPGAPVLVPPVTVSRAAAMPATAEVEQLSAALVRLAAVTAHRADLGPQLHRPVQRAADSGLLSSGAVARLRAAQSALARLDTSVLQHGDLSAQNWLVGPEGFLGLVDWETAVTDGVPGFDVLHAGVSLLEHGVALVRWSSERVSAAFDAAWGSSGHFHAVRDGFRRSAGAAGVSDDLLEPLELAFFGRRLGRRLAAPGGYAVGVRETAAALERVCRG